MVVHNEDTVVEQNLPLFIQQACDSDYEVIVVDDASTDETPAVLKSMKEQYPKLHTTFFPQSVLNPSRLQLALYVGIKAAKNDYIVLADIHRPPTSAAWIDGLSEAMSDRVTAVAMVYTDKKRTQEKAYQSFTQLDEAEPLIRKSERRSGKGHLGRRLKLKRGIYDAVAVSRECIYDAIRLYDQPIKGLELLGLRLNVFFKNLTV